MRSTRIGIAVIVIAGTPVLGASSAWARIGCDPNNPDPPCPAAVDDSYSTTMGVAFTVAGAAGVMKNDFGPQSLFVSVEDSDATSFYGNATITMHSSGGFTYTPDPATPFTGIDTFDYFIQDSAGDFDFATVSVTIPAVAKNDSYGAALETTLHVNAPGVLKNDKGVDSVDDWDQTTTHGGFVVMGLDGSFDYTPADGFFGFDTFKYWANDINEDLTYPATVTVQVSDNSEPPPPPPPAPPPPPPPPPPAPPSGYWMVGASGTTYAFGQVKNYGSASTAFVTHLEPTPSHKGYWIVNAAGHVIGRGDAKPRGDASALLSGEIGSSLSSTPTGNGYWLFTSRGRVFARGDAHSFGDLSRRVLNGPVVGSIATPNGKGDYMVASDGGIFTFGNARFRGSMGGRPLNKPVISLVPTKDNGGYWLVASDGGIFAFCDAHFRGSMGGKALNRPIVGMVRYGSGYLMVASDGGIFSFSNKPFVGSLGANPPATPIVGAATAG